MPPAGETGTGPVRITSFHMNPVRETFHKSERLCSRKIITTLFDEGNVFYFQIFKIIWIESRVHLPRPAQVAISVSKKGFRNAVTRNLLKRRIREAYRKNKHLFYEFLLSEKIQVAFVIIFRENTVRDYASIERSVKEMLHKFTLVISERTKKC
jgi:ribonuclease P protein component